MTAETVGRRERRKAAARERIITAAGDLFGARGFSAVTTGEIAEAADVGTGTLFRHAATKTELLVLVMNEQLDLGTGAAEAVSRGLGGGVGGGLGPADAVVELVRPLVDAFATQPENLLVYQREVLFGADGPHRAEALRRVRALETAIADVLLRHAERRPPREGADLALAAAAVFSTLYLRLVRLELGRSTPAETLDGMREETERLVEAMLY